MIDVQAAAADRGAALRRLVARLADMAPAGDNLFTVPPGAGAFDRVYGGQSLAEAFTAASRTVPPGQLLHSAHGYFLGLGNPACMTSYRVAALRDTRSFSIRQVRAEQDGRPILSATFSFTRAAHGMAHQAAMPPAPAPDTLPSRDVALLARYDGKLPKNAGVPWPIDIRHVSPPPWDSTIDTAPRLLWMRADTGLPDDPHVHAALLLFASDLTMVDAVTTRHPIVWEDLIAGRGYVGASLDHAFWLHAPARMDGWLLHVQESTRAAAGRGFATGRFFDTAGVMVASVAQEIFIRQDDRTSA